MIITPTSGEAAAPDRPHDAEFNIFDVLIVLARRKRLIILFPLVAVILAVPLSMLLPNVYTASTKIMPPQQAQSGAAAMLASLGGGVAAAAGAAMGPKNPNDMYIGMLRSRTIADRMIKRFDLSKVYGTKLQEKTRKALAQNTVIDAGKDGLIVIETEDEDPKRAADLANGYTDELLKLTKHLALTGAAQRRLFFERQLIQSKDNLANAEANLKGALNARGVISVDSESRAMVETVSRLRAQIAAKVIELESMRAFVTANNPEYKRNEQALSSMRSELNRLENGRPGADPAASSPAGLENIKVLREVKYHQMLYELLAKQYEVARLDEAKDMSIVQVLDEAIEPERHAKPKRPIIIVCIGIAALLLAIAWALLADALARAERNERIAPRLAELRKHLRLFGAR